MSKASWYSVIQSFINNPHIILQHAFARRMIYGLFFYKYKTKLYVYIAFMSIINS